jgi:dienelactone hydrolase
VIVRPLRIVIAVILLCAAALAQAQTPTREDAGYTEVFYPSGGLRIQAYLYKPEGKNGSAGPFAAVIYNHGTRDGRERESVPFAYVGTALARAGYVVLVTERRGYGKSDGREWWRDAPSGQADVVMRLQAETDDALAAVDYLRTLPYVDAKRLGVMGWSFGGIVTMLATSRSSAFAVAVDQAGGALSWDHNTYLRAALVEAAQKTSTPTLLLVAQNDATTASITTLAQILDKRGIAQRTVIYPPFTPVRGRFAAPGHAVFSSQGVAVWEKDVVEFLGRYLGAKRE